MGSWLVSAQYPTAMYLRVEAAMLPLLEYLREVNGEFSLEAEMHRACHARSSSFDPMPAVINAARFMVSALRGGRDPTRMGALWVRLMCDEPMGVYARMVSMLAALQPGERVIEFGAGVGNLTGQFDLTHVEYLRTDCLPEMLNGRFQCEERNINFEHELPRGLLGQYDKALAVNALHCATLPAQAVRNVSAALKPGGWLIVGEGSPVESWAMDPLFRFFDGWRGFRAREDWIEWFHEAGLRDVGYGRFVSGTVDLGGVVFGRRAP
jgi:SAM-dependent methyltransferase